MNVSDASFVGDTSSVGIPTENPKLPAGTGTYNTQTARNSQVAMDENGNFIISWESFQDDDTGGPVPDSWGILYRRFTFSQTTAGRDHLRNPAVAGRSQSKSRYHRLTDSI